MSADTVIHISVELDKKTFRRFATFDAFHRQKRWRMPAVFAAIMLAFAVYLFLQTDKPQSGLMGGVLAAIGLSLPVIYFVSYYISLRENVIKHCLPRVVYTLALTDSGAAVSSGGAKEEHVDLPWDTLHAAYRVKGAVYLYALPTRAFILPDGQADVSADALWAFLQEKLPGKCRGKAAN